MQCVHWQFQERLVDIGDNNCLILSPFFQYVSPSMSQHAIPVMFWNILGVMRAQNKLGSRTAGAMNVGLQSEKTNHK